MGTSSTSQEPLHRNPPERSPSCAYAGLAQTAWIEVWTTRQPPPNFQGRPLRIYYASQVETAPPVFHMSVNSEKYVTRSYEQFLINRIREDLGFAEVPFRLVFKSRRKEGGKRVRTQT